MNVAESFILPADGVSLVGGVRLPFAWRCGAGKLTLDFRGQRWVAADVNRSSDAVVRGSTALPSGGVSAHVLTEGQFLAGEDAAGALVVLGPETPPCKVAMTAILDRGGLGFISDYCTDRYDAPDAVPVISGATENDAASADCETRDFVGFAVTPRVGDRIRTLAATGNLEAKAECDACRFAGEATVETRVVAGKSSDELWLCVEREGGQAEGILRTLGDALRGISPQLTLRVADAPNRTYPLALAGEREAKDEGTVLGGYLCSIGAGNRFVLKKLAKFGCGAGLPETLRLCELEEVSGERAGAEKASGERIREGDVLSALRGAGVVEGDFLLVHSSLSALGWVEGGAGAVLAALHSAVGPSGTVLFPAFTCSFRTMGVVCKTWLFRPYDPRDLKSMKWVGSLAPELLRTEPESPRSRHLTNGWTGFGPRAAWALADHLPDDPPFGARSPLAKALEARGKAVFLGADVKSCTFLHHLEDRLDLPGLGPSLASVSASVAPISCPCGAAGVRALPKSGAYDVAIPRHVPGPREFYVAGEEARFFREAKARGLEIRRAPLGKGLVKAIELESLYRIGAEICRSDPNVLLGGNA